jgi:hypothetical protein
LVHLFHTSSLLSGPLPHSGLCQFKITVFTPLQWVYQPPSSFRFPSLSLFFPCAFYPHCVTHVQLYYRICFRSIICI